MKIYDYYIILPKKGNNQNECEDWFACSIINKRGDRRYVVADGATTGMLSGEWTKILADTITNWGIDISKDNILRIHKNASKKWEKWLKEYIQERIRRNKPIKWYEEPGLKAGAFSTLLVFTLKNNKERNWKAFAIGDSCIFKVRDDELLLSFPLTKSDDFNTSPPLLCSNLDLNNDDKEDILELKGQWNEFDEYFLMTDALAQWFLKEAEMGAKPWTILKNFIKHKNEVDDCFQEFIENLRLNRYIRNDDIAFGYIAILSDK